MPAPDRLLELPPPRGVAVCASDHSHYATPLGRQPPMTTVLSATSAGKARLQQWLQRPDAEAISLAARQRGTWTHKAIEGWITAHATGQAFPDPRHFAFSGYWRNIRPWLQNHWTQAVAIERTVYHPSGFAGTFDALGYVAYGRDPEALTLLDWKTSKRKRDDTLVEDYRCQLAGYALALNYVYGVRPQRALLVIARPAGPGPDIWELDADDLASATTRFKARLKRYYSMPPEP